MKNALGIALACIPALALAPAPALAGDEAAFGIGAGALYSGLGVNAALRGGNHMGYVAAGCIAVGYSSSTGAALPCGVAAGWVQAGLLEHSGNRHGLGIYVGPVNRTADNTRALYGVGLTYAYFTQGIDHAGWNFGLTPAVGNKNGKSQGALLLDLGYEF